MSLNIMEAFEAQPQPIDYVLPNLAIGTVGAIVSPRGVGKLMLALQLAVQITCGEDLLKFGDYPTGLVASLPVEDSESPRIIWTPQVRCCISLAVVDNSG